MQGSCTQNFSRFDYFKHERAKYNLQTLTHKYILRALVAAFYLRSEYVLFPSRSSVCYFVYFFRSQSAATFECLMYSVSSQLNSMKLYFQYRVVDGLLSHLHFVYVRVGSVFL
jgi:hypothetical protein